MDKIVMLLLYDNQHKQNIQARKYKLEKKPNSS
jgi:hypothetical protein